MATSVGRNSGSTATPTKATFSYWLKGQDSGAQQGIWGWHRGNDASNYWLGIYYSSNGSMYFNWKQSGLSVTLGTTQKFRDPAAWGHHVLAIDTTLGTAADRVKWYINGERVTSFEDSLDTISQNTTILNWSNAQDKMEIGTWYQNSSAHNLSNHSISHFHMIDGLAYDASAFGSTDSTTGEWTINTGPSVTYGNEGGFWFKDDAALTDRSGAGNNFTLDGGTLIAIEDCPSNIFASWNPLISNTGANFKNSNYRVYRTSAGNYRRIGCTIGATSGKYYAEYSLDADQWGGVCLTNGGDLERTQAGSNGYMGEYSADKSVGIRQDGIVYSHGANVSSAQWNQGTISGSDRLCLALDLDNKKLFLGKNGTWSSSSNPATNTGGISLLGDSYTFAAATSNGNCIINTGNGNFADGNTANLISSEGTNASGIGKFEYDVPTGYTALCTKGLNE